MGKRRATLISSLSLSLILLVFSIPVQLEVRADEQVLVEDDFESYTVGTFPYTGGWDLWFNGAGDQYQIIENYVSFSPTKSIQMLAQVNWAAHAVLPINTEASIIGYEAYVLVDENGGVHENSGRLGFSKRDTPTTVGTYAHVNFLDDGQISIGHPEVAPPGYVLRSYTPGTWYKVKVILDRERNAFSVWIDDSLLIEDVSFSDRNPYDYGYFYLQATKEANSKIYFDDVKLFSVFEANPQLILQPTSGIASTTLIGSGFAPASEITITWNVTKILSVPNPLVTDGYGNFTAIISVFNQTSSGPYEIKATDELGNKATSIFNVIPEFPSWTVLPLLLTATSAAVIIKRRLAKTQNRQ